MKQQIFLILVAALSLSSTFKNASALDVTGTGSHYVRVTRMNEKVKFEECFKGSSPECIRTLGPRIWYSAEELKSQRATETWQAYGSIVADVGIIVSGGFIGYMGGGFLAMGITESSALVGGLFGFTGGVAGSVAMVNYVQAVNPVEQFKQAGALSDDVINDRLVEKANMSRYIERLTLVLEKL